MRNNYLQMKSKAKVDLSAWQRVNGLTMIELLSYEEQSLIPLLNEKGKPCDFVMMDIDGNWQTTAGNKTLPTGFYSVLGNKKGNRSYISINPLTAAHASIYMGIEVICCYEISNLWETTKHLEEAPIVLVSCEDELCEADQLKFEQRTYNHKTRAVSGKIYQPYEIADLRKQRHE